MIKNLNASKGHEWDKILIRMIKRCSKQGRSKKYFFRGLKRKLGLFQLITFLSVKLLLALSKKHKL